MGKKYIRGYKWYLINCSIWLFLTILFFYLIPLLVSQDHQIAIDFFNFKVAPKKEINHQIDWLFIIYLIVGFTLLLIGAFAAVGRYGDQGNPPLGVKIILISLNLFLVILFKDTDNNLIFNVPRFLSLLWVQILIRLILFLSLTFIPISNYFYYATHEKANRFERFIITISDWLEG